MRLIGLEMIHGSYSMQYTADRPYMGKQAGKTSVRSQLEAVGRVMFVLRHVVKTDMYDRVLVYALKDSNHSSSTSFQGM